MKIFEDLAYASQFAAHRRQAAMSVGREEEGELWRYLSDQTYFIHQTGQAYRFEDYLKAISSTPHPHVSTALGAPGDAISQRAMALALKTLDETSEPEQARHAHILINLLNFLADTGQIGDFEDHLNHRLEYAPLAIAFFATREEAEAWLKGVEPPPSPARILVGDTYYLAWYSREDGARDISRDWVLEPYIEELTARGIPPSLPSFKDRGEAESWLVHHPASPFAFLSIAGEHYLAVHHKRLQRHTLHPAASALAEWEEEKTALEAAVGPENKDA